MAAAQPETVTFVLILNESDLLEFELKEANRPLYVHNYVDIIFMALLLIVAFASNVSLATTVATHRYLRSVPFNKIILSLTILHIMDIVFNGSVAITYMTRVFWDLGRPVCQINAFVVQLSLFVIPTSLVHAGVLLRSNAFQVTKTLIVTFICLTWIWSVFAALWSVIDDVARPYPARMSCNLGFEYLEYAAFSLAFNVIVPGIALSTLSVAFILTLVKDHRTRKRLTSRAWPRWSNSLDKTLSEGPPTPLRHDEIRSIYLWFALLVCYVVGCIPYAVLSFLQQVFQSPTDDTRWEVCISPNADAFVTWFRFLVTWAQAIAILALNEDLRQETLMMVRWWRHTSEDEPVALHATLKPSTRPKFERRMIAQNILGLTRCVNSVGITNTKTPVLFLGVGGLCLRRPHGDKNEFVQFFCDVISECCSNFTNNEESNEEFDENDSLDVQTQRLISSVDEMDGKKPRVTAPRSSQHRSGQSDWPQVARFSGPRHDMVNNNRSKSQHPQSLTAIGYNDK